MGSIMRPDSHCVFKQIADAGKNGLGEIVVDAAVVESSGKGGETAKLFDNGGGVVTSEDVF
jgi:hypothetical protein